MRAKKINRLALQSEEKSGRNCNLDANEIPEKRALKGTPSRLPCRCRRKSEVLIWNDPSTRATVFLLFSFPSWEAVGVAVEEFSRRLITLIFAGRSRIIVIRRELPRTRRAGSVRRPTA